MLRPLFAALTSLVLVFPLLAEEKATPLKVRESTMVRLHLKDKSAIEEVLDGSGKLLVRYKYEFGLPRSEKALEPGDWPIQFAPVIPEGRELRVSGLKPGKKTIGIRGKNAAEYFDIDVTAHRFLFVPLRRAEALELRVAAPLKEHKSDKENVCRVEAKGKSIHIHGQTASDAVLALTGADGKQEEITVQVRDVDKPEPGTLVLGIGEADLLETKQPIRSWEMIRGGIVDVETRAPNKFRFMGKTPGLTNVRFRDDDNKLTNDVEVVVTTARKVVNRQGKVEETVILQTDSGKPVDRDSIKVERRAPEVPELPKNLAEEEYFRLEANRFRRLLCSDEGFHPTLEVDSKEPKKIRFRADWEGVAWISFKDTDGAINRYLVTIRIDTFQNVAINLAKSDRLRTEAKKQVEIVKNYSPALVIKVDPNDPTSLLVARGAKKTMFQVAPLALRIDGELILFAVVY